MRKALFLGIFALCAAPAFAAETAQCDATAFTLKKPPQPAPKADKPQVPVKPTTVQAAQKKASPKKTTTRLISDCAEGKKKPRG